MIVRLDIDNARANDTVLGAVLAQADGDLLLPLIGRLLPGLPCPDRAALQTLAGAVEGHDLLSSQALADCLSPASDWRNSPSGLWLSALLFELRGDYESAVLLWDEIISPGAADQSEARLARSRLRERLGDTQEAFVDLRVAVAGQHDYGFLARASKLHFRLRRREAPDGHRPLRLAVVSSTTTDLLIPLLRLACFRDGIDAELYVSAYGNVGQEILDAGSGLYRFEPDIVLIATNWRDANLPAFSDDPETEVERVVAEFRSLWTVLLQRCRCHVIQHNLDIPAVASYGHLDLALPGGRGSMLRRINQAMPAAAPNAVTVLDVDHVSATFGKQAWSDAAYWHLAKQHPSAAALPLLVDHQVALIRAVLGMARKVLVFDLDNTLWGGVIGEDGLDGIAIGPPSASGEAYQALQTYAAELKSRGVVLGICSKNNQADATLPFESHDSMVLGPDDIAIFRANWMDKPSNLREMAQTVGLGLDSFVFVDDNPAERDLVRRELPMVAVPEIGSDAARFPEILDRGLYFQTVSLSDEDRARHESYRANALRGEMAASAASLDDFLRGLQMEVELGPFGDAVLARVVQLINKTNQFNLTTRRYSDAHVQGMTSASGCWTHYFRLRDRFGDNGLVGVLIAKQAADEPGVWEIDTWLMSCRVIGRRLEELMLATLLDAARAAQVDVIRGVYVPTAKNGMVADLYPRLGFSEIGTLEGGWVSYSLRLDRAPTIDTAFFRVTTVQAGQPAR